MKKTAVVLLAALFLMGWVYGFQQEEKAARSAQPRPELKTEIVTVKYFDAHWARDILRRYLSPFGKIQDMRQGNKIIIEDTPEFVKKALVMLEELDVKPVDLQFNVDLILGSTGQIPGQEPDKDLLSDPVIKELRSLMKYKFFKRVDSSIIKVQDNNRSRQRIGGNGMDLRMEVRPRHVKDEKGDSFQVELRLSKTMGINNEGQEIEMSLIDTTLSLKDGERTVVGVSKLSDMGDEKREENRDKALVLILSGKVLD